ncbi:BnaAnng15720D [Brassica napus]|uniref:(rape) hypothetical protein n=1 Tax=Brassica napus TaxID=3708 RepID=A0A078J7D0_BRANA|nr:unnamed protein product [Brassica napus]CAF2290816.1 unnamed protein product [Brassica napus]CDY59047.1 BnaAnng15720D [Brassica napus]
MAASFLWASRVASHLRTSVAQRGFSSVSGTVVEVNEVLTESPELLRFFCWNSQVNTSPYEEGWIIKVELSDAGKAEKLMDSDKYSKFCEEEDAKH